MNLSSPKIEFDNRLLAIEEEFRQRHYSGALRDLEELREQELAQKTYEHGLYLLLKADAAHYEGDYRKALEAGLRAAKKLADFPLNRRYGRVQLILSKAYSAMGELKNAEIRARDALASFRRASDTTGQIDSLNELARIAFMRCTYEAAAGFLGDAVAMAADDSRKRAQLTGNLGRVQSFTGQWAEAEANLSAALEFGAQNGEEISQALNLLSLGYLDMRRRRFTDAARRFSKAHDLIERLGLQREKVIYLEYVGELALERGDTYRAKALLTEAYQKGMLMAPGSTMVCQTGRRLAQVELLLDSVDEAMKYGQKALDIALVVGEHAEVGVVKRLIAEVFSARSDHEEAVDYIQQAVETLRVVGDPYELARALLVEAGIRVAAGASEPDRIRSLYEEAHRLFRRLQLEYWMAEVDYRAGILACQSGDLAVGFQKLSRAERVFSASGDKVRVRAVSRFLRSLSDQAVALSISQENEYKVFGNLVTPAECSDLKSSRIEDVLSVLLKKAGANRALVFVPEEDGPEVLSTFPLGPQQVAKFDDGFRRLLGEEISKVRPTLILDCRHDPFINGLFPHLPAVVASVIVVPFRLSEGEKCYLYLDRLTEDSSLSPFSQTELNFAVGFSDVIALKWTEIQKAKLLEDNRRLKSQLAEKSDFPSIITQNSTMLLVLGQVRQVVDSNISVSIEGDTGSGKDLLARAIHFNSARKDKRFISVNCAALPETLLESELFGYKRGAFTGADRDKSGLFEEADGGTFFLDEIADMPLSIQAKVLRVLEEKEIVRLGETVPRKVDVRVISATNKDLKEQMAAGLFRQDLYYRLSAMNFRLPPLRERREDIPLLIAHFLDGAGKKMSAEAMHLMVAYDWPGNVRELENEVKKLVLMAGESPEIGVGILSPKLQSDSEAATAGKTPVAEPNGDIVFSDAYSLYDYLASFEKRFIVEALRKKNGVKKHAAALLSIPESTLRLKIKQYGIDLRDLGARA